MGAWQPLLFLMTVASPCLPVSAPGYNFSRLNVVFTFPQESCLLAHLLSCTPTLMHTHSHAQPLSCASTLIHILDLLPPSTPFPALSCPLSQLAIDLKRQIITDLASDDSPGSFHRQLTRARSVTKMRHHRVFKVSNSPSRSLSGSEATTDEATINKTTVDEVLQTPPPATPASRLPEHDHEPSLSFLRA